MPSSTTAFVVGMATAAAIAAGFAGVFMEQVERKRTTEALLRPPPGPATAIVLPAPPTTSGYAIQERPAVQVDSRGPVPPLPSPSAAPFKAPSQSAAVDPQAQPKAAEKTSAEQPRAKDTRKHVNRSARRKHDWDRNADFDHRNDYRNDNRNRRGFGLFDFFR